MHQIASHTYFNRYPEIFSACRDHFKGKHRLKLLSYGCSTGEEVLTLRHYFPDAYIVGAEINKRSLEICRSLPVDDKIRFVYSTYDELSRYAYYDAIFCMAVLQRDPHIAALRGIRSLKNIYPFEKFERQIVALDSLLKIHGLLVVHYTQYSLLDTMVGFRYKPVKGYYQSKYYAPVFDRHSNITNNRAPLNSIYFKLF